MKLKLFLIILVFFIYGCSCSELASLACDNIEDKDHCWQKVALTSKDPALCEKIVEAAPKSKCYLLLAISMKDGELCKKMPTTGTWTYRQNECWYNMGKESGAKTYCDFMTGGGDGSDVTPGAFDKDKCVEEADKKREEIGTDCGEPGQACCEGFKCSEGSLCEKDICVEQCGVLGFQCCEDNSCTQGVCSIHKECVSSCGGNQEIACYGSKCNEWLKSEGANCYPCGEKDKECCPTQAFKCKPELGCATDGYCRTDSTCGEHGRKPCKGNQCHGNNVYNAQLDVCLFCGYPGIKCCTGYILNTGDKDVDLKDCYIGKCSGGVCG